MADNKDPHKPKPDLSDEIAEKIKGVIIHGTGYGQPPKEHQFKQGQSGNPKGRPRKAAPDLSLSEQPLLNAMYEATKQTVKARDGDKIVEMTGEKALAQAALNFALKGNARYYGILVDAARQAEEANAREIRRRTELWKAYQTAAREQIAEAKAKGEPEPELLPHPDDIVFDRETGPDFVGPFDEVSHAEMQKTLAFRETLTLQAALDERLWPDPEDEDPCKGPGTALEFAKLMNRALPPRLRKSEFLLYHEMDSYCCHPKRWLLKETTASWQKLGKRRKRGALFPPLGVGLAALKLIFTLGGRVMDGSLSETTDLRQFEDLIADNERFAKRAGWL